MKHTGLLSAFSLCFALATGWSITAAAQSSIQKADAPAAGGEQQIRQKLKAALPTANITDVKETPIQGMYQVEINGSEITFVSEQSDYLIAGDLYQVTDGGLVNETEKWRGAKRKEVIAGLKKEDMIVFAAKAKAKGELFVFTDVDCGYCQKFHDEVPKLSELGVTVNYIAWPRAGVESHAGKVMRNVWCADDPLEAMTLAKTRRDVPEAASDCVAPIDEQLAIGRQLGIRGTPAVFLADGQQVGGYRSAADFAKLIGVE